MGNFELTVQDLEVLVEAMTAWEEKDFAGEMLGDLFGAIMSDKLTEEGKKKLEEEKKEKNILREKQKKVRKEQSIMIKAKLLSLKTKLEVETIN